MNLEKKSRTREYLWAIFATTLTIAVVLVVIAVKFGELSKKVKDLI